MREGRGEERAPSGAGVGIGMPALVLEKSMILMKNDDQGYAKSLNKSVFAVFVFCKNK